MRPVRVVRLTLLVGDAPVFTPAQRDALLELKARILDKVEADLASRRG